MNIYSFKDSYQNNPQKKSLFCSSLVSQIPSREDIWKSYPSKELDFFSNVGLC